MSPHVIVEKKVNEQRKEYIYDFVSKVEVHRQKKHKRQPQLLLRSSS